MNPIDPVHELDDSWWFYDETWSNSHGPFESEEEAKFYLELYLDELNGRSLG